MREMFSPEIEKIDRKELRQMQLERLKHIVRYAYENVPMYRKRFDSIGLKPEHIRTLKDIENIPYTTKDDLRDNYPFGLFAVPMKKIIRLHASSGTTGKPIVGGYTRADLDNWSTCIARLLAMAGATDEDIFQVAFGYGLFTGGFGLHYGIEKLGATVVPMSTGNTERQLMLMRDFGVTALIATPSYAMYLAETAKKEGILKDLKVRLVCMGAEASTAETHESLQKLFGAFPTENYGLTEVGGPGVAGECREKAGMHINEDMFYAEIVNMEKNQVLQEGEQGEMVITTLVKEGMPILRYRTKDITSLTYEPCKCGRTLARMSRVVGRTDDMLIIRGVNVFPSQIEAAIMNVAGVSPHYMIYVDRVNNLDVMEIDIELAGNLTPDRVSDIESIKRKVETEVNSYIGLSAKIKLCESGSIRRSEGKAVRVIDRRDQ